MKWGSTVFRSIRTKLIVLIVALLVVIAASVLGAVLYYFTEFIDGNAAAQARTGVEGMHGILEEAKREMKIQAVLLAANPDVTKAVEAKDTVQVLAVMGRLLKDIPVDSVTVSDGKGTVIARTHEPGKSGDSVAGQANVREALKGNATSGVEPGTVVKLSARAGAPVRNAAGQIVGVITPGVTLTKNETVDKAKNMYKVDTTIFLGDVRESTTVSKDGKRQTGTKLDPAIAEVLLKQGKRYDGAAAILGMPYLTSYEPILDPGGKVIGILFAGKPLTEAHATRDKMVVTVAGVTLIILLLAFLVTWLIAKKITDPLLQLGTGVSAVAGGDLTRTVPVRSADEVGVLTKDFNTMLNHLRELVKHVHDLSQTLAASAEELTASAEQSAEVSQQVARSITEVAVGTSRQLHAVHETSSVVGQVSSRSHEMSAASGAVNDTGQKATAATLKGGEAIERAVKQMVDIGDGSRATGAAVKKLEESSRHIGEIVNVISGIAGQTNLLALNAAIEAARAGEQGRGFAVVAEEVRKLAEQSESAAKEITDLIKKNQIDIDQAVQTMEQGETAVRTGIEVVNAAGVSFREIAKMNDEVSAHMAEVSTAIGEVAGSSEKIVDSVAEIETVSKAAAAQAENVSAAAEELTASMAEISSSSRSLAQMAQELQVAVGKFHM